MLLRPAVGRKASWRGAGLPESPERKGSTATAPGSATADFFLLDGGIREGGKVTGTGSFSMARYTRCIAWRQKLYIYIYSYVACLFRQGVSVYAPIGFLPL